MTMNLTDGTPLIGDFNYQRHHRPIVDGVKVHGGCRPRDLSVQPREPMRALNIPLIPQTEWAERIKHLVAAEASLDFLRLRANGGQPAPSLDQNGKGYCWAHSTTHCNQLLRYKANLPYVPLSAYAVACKIKNFQDEGGWGALSMQFIQDMGQPSQEVWPQQSMDRSHDNPATWKNAEQYKITEGWVDLADPVYDRTLSFSQEITLYLSGVPVVKDENWWGHSICGLCAVDGAAQRNQTRADSGKLADLNEFEAAWGMNDPVTAGIGVKIWNSWSDSWGQLGTGILTGSKAVSDGAVAPLVTTG